MSPKSKRRLLQLIGFIIGSIFGYFRPFHMQNLLPILAIGVGISYFIYSFKITDDDESTDDILWFPIVQMIMYFLIGGMISSTIILAIEMF